MLRPYRAVVQTPSRPSPKSNTDALASCFLACVCVRYCVTGLQNALEPSLGFVWVVKEIRIAEHRLMIGKSVG